MAEATDAWRCAVGGCVGRYNEFHRKGRSRRTIAASQGRRNRCSPRVHEQRAVPLELLSLEPVWADERGWPFEAHPERAVRGVEAVHG